MVIKSKKWKNSIGFISFFFSVTLLLTGGSILLSTVLSSGFSEGFSTMVSEDYQNTKEFQSFISDRLNDFLDMASGDYVYSGYDSSGETTSTAEDFVAESYTAESVACTASYDWDIWENDVSYTEQEKKSFAENFHNLIKTDKNLLYVISYDGTEMYTNREDTSWDGTIKNLPDGYNFCLHYDGTAANIWKDGKQIDIYGDGIYRESEDWYLPGYHNYTGKSQWQKADIIFIVAAEPVRYVKMNDDGSYYTQNRLYYMRQDFLYQRKNFQYSLCCIGIGLCFFLLYLKFRREKQQADLQLAYLTGKIWLEVKVLLFIFLPLIAAGGLGYDYAFAESTIALKELYVAAYDYSYSGYGTDYFREVFLTLLRTVLFSPVLLVIIFWICYLFCNDIQKNTGWFRHGIIGKIIAATKNSDLTLPLSRRLAVRFRRIFLLLGAVCLLSLILLLVTLLFGLYQYCHYALDAVLCFLLILVLIAAYFYQKGNRQMAIGLEQLETKISAIHDGNYENTVSIVPEDADLQQMAQQLEDIRQGMETAVEERLKSERMKVELVANVSHDIKTPLTSIISYIELLKQEEHLPEDVKDYIHILDEKAERLKNMVQDVFSVSKAASGQLAVELEELDFGRLLHQTLADMDEQIRQSPAVLRTEIPETPVMVRADGHRMYRVFQNLIGNALKYSLEGSRIYITLTEEASSAVACIRNTSRNELRADIDFTARFTRGDESRTDGGSGLGLSIAKSFTEACGGTFTVETMADLFVVKVSFEHL